MVTANAYLADRKTPTPVPSLSSSTTATAHSSPARLPTGKVSAVGSIADLNGDGKPDLATANVDDNTASVFLNRGDGGFEPRRDYLAGAGPRWVAIGDLNNDGRPDLVTANTGSLRVSVLLNKGDGNFRAPRSYPSRGSTLCSRNRRPERRRKPDLATANKLGHARLGLRKPRRRQLRGEAQLPNGGVPSRSRSAT